MDSPLRNHQGRWQGTNHLWLEDPVKAELSDGTMTVVGDSLTVEWAFRTHRQRGTLACVFDDGMVRMTWTDSWHTPKPMECEGTVEDGVVDVVGHYHAGHGPDWGWRTVLDLRDPDQLVLRMFNIAPTHEEVRAVELVGTRSA